jgi:hypothetical protein
MPKFVKYYDANRVRKTYPLIRLKPVETSITNSSVISVSGINAEVTILAFANSFSETYTFTETYSSVPVIVATPEDENVNIFITSLTTTSVTVQSSAPFTGNVHLHIYEDD